MARAAFAEVAAPSKSPRLKRTSAILAWASADGGSMALRVVSALSVWPWLRRASARPSAIDALSAGLRSGAFARAS